MMQLRQDRSWPTDSWMMQLRQDRSWPTDSWMMQLRQDRSWPTGELVTRRVGRRQDLGGRLGQVVLCC